MVINEEVVTTYTGVPQGGTLSPLLFLIYIDDLIKDLQTSTGLTLAYADDLVVATSSYPQLL